MTNPLVCSFSNPSFRRLADALGLQDLVTEATLHMDADKPIRMTVTRLLSPEEVDAVTDWLVGEGIEAVPAETSTYDLQHRETPQ